MPPLADEDAAAIFEVLDRHGVAYVVIGGMAAAMWGSDLPRTTDADITPAADTANLARLAAALAELGARLRVEANPSASPPPSTPTPWPPGRSSLAASRLERRRRLALRFRH